MTKKIINTIIPKEYWVSFFLLVLIALMGKEFLMLATVGFNILLMLIGLKLAILLHEIGHLLFARIVGGTPRYLILGKGHLVTETRFLGIKVILNSNFNSGLGIAAFDNLKFIRFKLLCYTSGGFLTNFLVAFILFSFSDFSLELAEGIQWTATFCLANLYIGISVLIPTYSTYQGLRLPSDGRSILQIPFHKKSDLTALSTMNELLDANDLFDSKKYIEAIASYENYQLKNKESKTINYYISIAQMKLGNFERALELMEELLPLINEESFIIFRNYIHNGLAWNYLLLNKLEEADKFSEIAYKTDPDTDFIRGTRASILIEKGEFEKGKNLLIPDVDFDFPNNNTLSAAMYLGLAFNKLNEPKEAEKYISFAEKNVDLLDMDEKTLFNRINERWQNRIIID